MSHHDGPHFTLPAPEDRCQAIVKGQPSYHWKWMREDHQCPRKANQGRAGKLVCHQHAKAKDVTYVE